MSLVEDLKQNYALSRDTLVWSPEHAEPFAYCDGPDESVLYDCFDNAIDVSCGAEELQQHINNWPMRYHLSPQRVDLLRPLKQLLQGRVLEIGAGCGALTRYLGETAAEVVGIEGALARAVISRKRCRDLHNVQIVCDNAMRFDAGEQFDAVTLVGVLEYSRQYVQAKDPVDALLRHCLKQLRDDGALIIAIENQLGAKYFAGAPEDHTGVAFDGINNLYTDTSVVTFGKKELLQRIGAAGFADIEFYYPFPDYKLPSVILTEDGAQRATQLIDNLASRMSAYSQAIEYPRLFSEEMLYGPIARNGLLGELANSFLVVARRQTQPKDAASRALAQAFIYSTLRGRRFAKETRIWRQAGTLHVARQRLYPALAAAPRSMQQHLCDKPMLQGELYSNVLRRLVNRAGWSSADVAAWAKPWVQHLQLRAIPTQDASLPDLPGALLDCCPFNMIRQPDGSFATFDLEWTVPSAVPLVYVLLRGLWHSLGMLQSVAQPRAGTPVHVMLLVAAVMDELGYVLSNDELKSIWTLEVMFFDAIDSAAWLVRLRVRDDVRQLAERVESQRRQIETLSAPQHQPEDTLFDDVLSQRATLPSIPLS